MWYKWIVRLCLIHHKSPWNKSIIKNKFGTWDIRKAYGYQFSRLVFCWDEDEIENINKDFHHLPIMRVLFLSIDTCIHAYIHTDIHTYIHTYIHIYIYILVYDID